MFEPKYIALAVFIVAYLWFIVDHRRRTLVAMGSVGLLVLCGVMSGSEVLRAINWNVMGIFVGMLAVADIFMESRVPAYLAEMIVDRAKNVAWAMLFVCMLSGFFSAFVENVATVLIIAPIALSLTQKLKISPVKMMIGIAISSNLQGAATLIGDPPSMLLGGFAKMNFFDFFFYQGKPSIFFAVQIGAIASFVVLYYVFREYRQKVELIAIEKVKSWTPTVLLAVLIILLALSAFFDKGFSGLAGILCMVFGVISVLWKKWAGKASLRRTVLALDWNTTWFLIGVFVLVGSLTETGWIESFSDVLTGMIGTNIFLGYTLWVFLSVALSAFIDNVPYLATMLPVAISMAEKLNVNPSIFLFGLLVGASLGGNITPIGASANIVACSMLKKEGYTVKFGEFVRIGLPFTMAAVTAAYVFVWLVWR
ncbi:MAG: SLC13 family permease [Candidatus Omnitrophica bacterium]|nr:SLC13 family permease [Candidatus Omnitrophota bacterium]